MSWHGDRWSATGLRAGTWNVVSPKLAGFAPGFTMRDSRNDLWFVSFDAAGHPEAATGAIAVANRIFWALGLLAGREPSRRRSHPNNSSIAESATVTPPSGRKRPMRPSDLDAVLRRAHRSEDGSYRAIAARAVPGRPVGGFRYYGTRPDDPNDVVPHEHRRELRALKVFGAWTNLVDMKAGNTLDSVVVEGGRSVVRHYLQDVGSTFGTGANGPREYDEGWEFLYEGGPTRSASRAWGSGSSPGRPCAMSTIQRLDASRARSSIPPGWRPRVPTAASCARVPTITSGPRDASRRSATR